LRNAECRGDFAAVMAAIRMSDGTPQLILFLSPADGNIEENRAWRQR
jgi:hypothetical protein